MTLEISVYPKPFLSRRRRSLRTHNLPNYYGSATLRDDDQFFFVVDLLLTLFGAMSSDAVEVLNNFVELELL